MTVKISALFPLLFPTFHPGEGEESEIRTSVVSVDHFPLVLSVECSPVSLVPRRRCQAQVTHLLDRMVECLAPGEEETNSRGQVG